MCLYGLAQIIEADRRKRLCPLDQIDQSRWLGERERDQQPTCAHQTEHGKGCESRECHRLHVAAPGVSGNEMNDDTESPKNPSPMSLYSLTRFCCGAIARVSNRKTVALSYDQSC